MARVLTCLLLLIAARDSAVRGQDITPIRVDIRDGYLVVVPVSVNGLAPVDFVLDTGTRTTLVDRALVASARLAPVARMPFTTFTGTLMLDVVRFDRISLGDANADGIEAASIDLGKAYSLHRSIRGVLGQNFLSRFSYLLDYRARRILLDREDDLRLGLSGERLPVEERELRDYLRHGDGPAARGVARFLLDSGVPLTVLFVDRILGSGLRFDRTERQFLVSSSLGTRRTEHGTIWCLTFGGVSVRNVPVLLTSETEIENRHEDGLLPTCLFDAVYVNHVHEPHFVILNPRPAPKRPGPGYSIASRR